MDWTEMNRNTVIYYTKDNTIQRMCINTELELAIAMRTLRGASSVYAIGKYAEFIHSARVINGYSVNSECMDNYIEGEE